MVFAQEVATEVKSFHLGRLVHSLVNTLRCWPHDIQIQQFVNIASAVGSENTKLLQNHFSLLGIESVAVYFIGPDHYFIETLRLAYISEAPIVWVDTVLVSDFHSCSHVVLIGEAVAHDFLF